MEDGEPIAVPSSLPTQSNDDSTESISILDLMDVAEEEHSSPDDQDTPTGPPIPISLPQKGSKPAAPPLYKSEKTITVPPSSRDEGATRVQPRVAFPGSTDPQLAAPGGLPATSQPEPPKAAAAEPSARARGQAGQRHLAPPRQVDWGYAAAAAAIPVPESLAQPVVQAKRKRRNWGSCLMQWLVVGVLFAVAGIFLGAATVAAGYAVLAADLPSPAVLESRTSDFETAVIYDREGNELYSLADPNAGNRTYVTLDRISPQLINATIATEDARFYSHPGFDPPGIARAIVQAAQEGEFVSGASTITQQLVRALLLDEQERTEQTFRRKLREIILAAELNRIYPGRAGKDKILELYLNEINYGNRAYGIEAAAQTYFDKSAADLNLAEASLLAGLPQAPALWDPFSAPELALNRQAQVLGLMVQQGYISQSEAQDAINESAIVVRGLTPPEFAIQHPHFVFTVLQQLENEFGAQAIYQGGFRVYTTLDPQTQELATEALLNHRANANALGANNGAIVAVKPDSGEILALVGSFDFNDEEIRGQVNMALAPRQPGSSIKPLVYLAAMEAGWTPATLIWDVATEFPDGANPPYVPKNFDDEFHGPILLREALGNSYNIPAVKALEYVGVCSFIANMQKLGLTSLLDDGCQVQGQPSESGLSLALGGREVSPLDMATAFGALANGGLLVEPYAISRIENSRSELLYTYAPPETANQQGVRPAHAFLLSHILADNDARQPEFGLDNPLVIDGHIVAAKTGTSGSNVDDTRDGWTIGYTPQIVTAVWVGNTDANPVARGASGFRMATPIWSQFMSGFLADKAQLDFLQPASVVPIEICADSGARPDADCPARKSEYFAADQLPLSGEAGFVQRLPVDLWTNLIANSFCQEATVEVNFVSLLVTGRPEVIQRETINARQWVEQTQAGARWAEARGISLPLRLPPTQSCRADTPRPAAAISNPAAQTQLAGEAEIIGTANGPGFSGYQLEFGLSHNPEGWAPIRERRLEPVVDGVLGRWNTTEIRRGGPATIRLLLFGPDNPYTAESDPVTLEVRVPVMLAESTATSTDTPKITPTATETGTPTPTVTIAPTATEGKPTETPTPEPASPTPSPEPPEPTPSPTTDSYP